MRRKTATVIICLVALSALAVISLKLTHVIPTRVAYKNNRVDDDTDEQDSSNSQLAASVSLTNTEAAGKVKYEVSSSTPQFVILSFDGSKSVEMLNETLDFEQKMQSENKPLHFTYFINAAYFLTKDNATLYQPPQGDVGTSKIGFSNSSQDIPLRVNAFNKAFSLSNEIGSHTVGHFNGGSWSYDEWMQEFNSFVSILSNVQKNNPSEQIDAPNFLSNMVGFRAPQLAVDDNLYKTLAATHFSYDASGVNSKDQWPTKDQYGLWHIPLSVVHIGENKSPIIAMDYNLWLHQSGGKNLATKDTPLWSGYFDQVESAYTNYFNDDYNGNRVPIVIGDHFSKWNDGVYWEAMKAFAENVCGQANVRCVTFGDLVGYLNTVGVPSVSL